jgi:hypothetical protein
MKKKIILFLAIALCLCATNKAMSQVVGTGATGDCTWTLTGTSGNYTLTISGNGAMEDYTYGQSPWYSYRSSIKTIDIQQGVTSIGDYTFFNCNVVSSVTIPNSVTIIGEWGFRGCDGLTSITIPNSVTHIGYGAFYWCTGLTSVSIPSSVTYIGYSAFGWCFSLLNIDIDANNMHYSSLDGVLFNKSQDTLIQYPVGRAGSYIVPNSVITIGSTAFSGSSNLTSVTIPNSVTSIEGAAFSDCDSLTSIDVGASVTSIGPEAFARCYNLVSAIISPSVITIEPYAFADCNSLTSVTMGNSVKIIGDAAFTRCPSLLSVTIPNSVTSIEDRAFSDCDSLTSVTMGNSVETIGDWAFYNCTELTEIYIKAKTPPQIEANTFGEVPANIPVHVPCGMATAYQSAADWDYFSNYMDDLLSILTVESNDSAMGTANVIQANTCTDDTAIIDATANPDYHFVQWNDGNTDNPRTVTITEDTIFIAEFELVVGISKIDAPAVAVYPNPAIDNITVTLPESVAQAVFTLYDMQGRVLMHQSVDSGDAVSIGGIAAGMYIYNVTTEKGSYKGKLEVNQ